MRTLRLDLRGSWDPTACAVWISMLLLGGAAWYGSGTAVAGAAIVVAVLLAVASPSGAMYGTCAAIPLVYHPIEVGTSSFGLLELGIFATALGTSVRMGLDLANGTKPELSAAIRPVWLLVFPVSLLAIGTLSLVWMPYDLHQAEALRTWRWVIVEPVVLFGLARIAIARHGRSMLAIAIAVPAAVVAAAALGQLIESSSSFSVDDVHRSTATYLHPNNLALYLERALFLVLVPGLIWKRSARWLLLGLSCSIAAGIAVTFSRGALLGLVAGFAVLLLAHPVQRGWRYLAIGAGVAAVAFGLVATQRFTGSGSSGVLATRRYLWGDSFQMLRDFPISGVGLDQFLWMHQQRYISPQIWSERYVSHPHNLLLDAWLSLGIAGVALLASFLIAGTWMIVMLRRHRIEADSWQLGALACLGAGLGHGLVDNGYFLADLAALTWLAIAIAAPSNGGAGPSAMGDGDD